MKTKVTRSLAHFSEEFHEVALPDNVFNVKIARTRQNVDGNFYAPLQRKTGKLELYRTAVGGKMVELVCDVAQRGI